MTGTLFIYTISLSLSDMEDTVPSPIADESDLFIDPSSANTSINQSPSSLPGVNDHHHRVTAYPTITEEEGEGDVVNSLTVTLSLPEQSRGRGIQPSQRRRDNQRVLLVFHGIILRSQLVTLLENKIFFSEGDGVCTVLYVHSNPIGWKRFEWVRQIRTTEVQVEGREGGGLSLPNPLEPLRTTVEAL